MGMPKDARSFYSDLNHQISKHDTVDLCVDCDVFGTLLADFTSSSLNIPLMKALQWFRQQGYRIRIVSSHPIRAEALLRESDFDQSFFPVVDKKDLSSPHNYVIALRIDDEPIMNSSSESPQYVATYHPHSAEFQAFLSAFLGEEIAPPDPKNIKRMLIVDDDLGRYMSPSFFFKNSEIPVEVGYATNSKKALKIIDDWISQGYGLDLISCDDNRKGMGEHGVSVLTTLMQHIENINPNYLPPQMFIHSKGDVDIPLDFKWGTPDSLQFQEFQAMAREGKFYDFILGLTSAKCFENHHFFSTKLRKYCNQHWGTNFATSASEQHFYYNPKASLDLEDIQNLIGPKNSSENIFDRCRTDQISSLRGRKRLSYLKGWEYAAGIDFKNAVGDAVVGRLAFDKEDIETLKSQDLQTPIILCIEKYDPKYISLLSHVEGVILLGEDPPHLKLILDNAGISGILTMDREDNQREKKLILEGKTLIYCNKYWDDDKEEWALRNIFVSVGDTVSIDYDIVATSSMHESSSEEEIIGQFFPIEIPYQKSFTHYPPHHFSRLSSAADSLRKKYSSLTIVSNADTAEQIGEACLQKSEGIGLIRSEHMFYEPDHLELLQKIMTTDNNEERQHALNALQVLHSKDIDALLCAAKKIEPPFPLTFRLLDAPLEEFCPPHQQKTIIDRVGETQGRGVQFALQTQGLYEMQIKALFESIQRSSYTPNIRIMVPHLRTVDEALRVKNMISPLADQIPFEFGGMIETVESVKNIESLAPHFHFASIGTNDLMSDLMGGIHRVDYEGITEWMIENKVKGDSPFKKMPPILQDTMQYIANASRTANPNIHLSACGQHMGTDEIAPDLALSIGLDSISVPNRDILSVRLLSAYYANAKRHDLNKAGKTKITESSITQSDLLQRYKI